MGLHSNLGWLFGVFAFVALFSGGSFMFIDDSSATPELIQFSDLSDADIDVILSVKAKMQNTGILPN